MNTSPAPATTRPARCNYLFADARRCRMLRHHSSDELCLFHHREFTHLQFSEALGAELVSLGGNFQNEININLVLGKIFAAVATGRMHRRDASTLAYIAQLLLQTIQHHKFNRPSDRHDYRAFRSAINRRYPQSRPNKKHAAPSPPASPLSHSTQPTVAHGSPLSTAALASPHAQPQTSPSAHPLKL